jgi:c-di-GMP phosphodiesterase
MAARPNPRVRVRPGEAAAGRTGNADGLIRDVRVGRQAIYDAARRVVSFQLTFNGGDALQEDAAGHGASEQVTSQVIGTTFGTFGLASISDGRPVFITFTRAFLTGMLPIPVEPDNVIIEVTDQVAVDHELLLGLARLAACGYRIAVDNYRGDLGRSALLERADFVKIDIDSLPTLVVPGLVASCRATGARLIASDIRDAGTLQRCMDLGFELFQGEYLQRPVVMAGRVLSPSQLVCVRLLNELADPQVPVAAIERLVRADPGLSIRLLRSAHSAAGAGQQVDSLHQALVLIGLRRLRSWVVLTLLDGSPTSNTSDGLWSVLARAGACQRLSSSCADLGYTVGLLAGAADLLGADLVTVADSAGVGQEARAALLNGDGEAGRALRAVLAHERQDDSGVDESGLARYDVSRSYLESLSEALHLVHDVLGHPVRDREPS